MASTDIQSAASAMQPVTTRDRKTVCCAAVPQLTLSDRCPGNPSARASRVLRRDPHGSFAANSLHNSSRYFPNEYCSSHRSGSGSGSESPVGATRSSPIFLSCRDYPPASVIPSHRQSRNQELKASGTAWNSGVERVSICIQVPKSERRPSGHRTESPMTHYHPRTHRLSPRDSSCASGDTGSAQNGNTSVGLADTSFTSSINSSISSNSISSGSISSGNSYSLLPRHVIPRHLWLHSSGSNASATPEVPPLSPRRTTLIPPSPRSMQWMESAAAATALSASFADGARPRAGPPPIGACRQSQATLVRGVAAKEPERVVGLPLSREVPSPSSNATRGGVSVLRMPPEVVPPMSPRAFGRATRYINTPCAPNCESNSSRNSDGTGKPRARPEIAPTTLPTPAGVLVEPRPVPTAMRLPFESMTKARVVSLPRHCPEQLSPGTRPVAPERPLPLISTRAPAASSSGAKTSEALLGGAPVCSSTCSLPTICGNEGAQVTCARQQTGAAAAAPQPLSIKATQKAVRLRPLELASSDSSAARAANVPLGHRATTRQPCQAAMSPRARHDSVEGFVDGAPIQQNYAQNGQPQKQENRRQVNQQEDRQVGVKDMCVPATVSTGRFKVPAPSLKGATSDRFLTSQSTVAAQGTPSAITSRPPAHTLPSLHSKISKTVGAHAPSRSNCLSFGPHLGMPRMDRSFPLPAASPATTPPAATSRTAGGVPWQDLAVWSTGSATTREQQRGNDTQVFPPTVQPVAARPASSLFLHREARTSCGALPIPLCISHPQPCEAGLGNRQLLGPRLPQLQRLKRPCLLTNGDRAAALSPSGKSGTARFSPRKLRHNASDLLGCVVEFTEAGCRGGLEPPSKLYYQLERILQSAIFGAVFEATEHDSSPPYGPTPPRRSVALKVLHKDLRERSTDLQEDISAETRFHHAMSGHPNVLVYDHCWEENNCVFIVMPLAKYGDLFELLKSRKTALSESEARWLFQRLLNAADFLHRRGVAFRDHSLENVLLFGEPTSCELVPKITDPGQAVFLRYDSEDRVQMLASGKIFGKSFRAPEIYIKGRYDATKVDTFCMGWMLFFAVAKRPLFSRALFSDPDWFLVLNGSIPTLLSKKRATHLSPSLTSLIFGMVAPDPSTRLSVQQCLAHPWVLEEPKRPLYTMDVPPKKIPLPPSAAAPVQEGTREDDEKTECPSGPARRHEGCAGGMRKPADSVVTNLVQRKGETAYAQTRTAGVEGCRGSTADTSTDRPATSLSASLTFTTTTSTSSSSFTASGRSGRRRNGSAGSSPSQFRAQAHHKTEAAVRAMRYMNGCAQAGKATLTVSNEGPLSS